VNRQLRADKLVETARNLQRFIAERFPDSGLSQVSAEVATVTQEALVRAALIGRPHYWLRGGLILLVLFALAGVVTYTQTQSGELAYWRATLNFLDETKGTVAFLTAAAIFLITLETRIKRQRAIKAIRELRALAHIIDMHQLTKDPDRIGDPILPVDVASAAMDAEAMGLYLHYCTELLAVTGKIGQLYVQDFPDAQATAAVDQFEGLATGLSSKIWQKLMMLDRIRGRAAKEGR
jgi:hypothetical protein